MRFFSLICGLSGVLVADWAYACPLCRSSVADEVRAGIVATAQDGSALLALLGPFVASILLLSLLNRLVPDGIIPENERTKK